MNTKDKILLSGYFQENLGDDLFFKIITEKFHSTPFYTYSCIGFHSNTFQQKNLEVPLYIRVLNPLFSFLLHTAHHRKVYGLYYRIISVLERCLKKVHPEAFKAELVLSGSCFMMTDNGADNIDLTAVCVNDTSYCLKENSRKRYVCGSNIGPVSKEAYLDDIKHQLETYNDVCFRDKTSYELFSFMPNVRYAPDIIFNLDISSFSDVRQEKKIFVSLVDLSNKISNFNSDRHTYNRIAEVLKTYCKQGYKIVLVSFCKLERDQIALKRIASRIDSKLSKLIIYNGKNLDCILNEMASSEYVIAGRFHAMILAMLFGKPFYPVCYDDKMINYLRDISFTGKALTADELPAVGFDDVNENLRNKVIVDVTEHVQNAHLQFAAFKKFLTEEEK